LVSDNSKYNFQFKNIADPIHGTIGLSELETKIIETKAFQRLRNVKHLGLASYVYPGADFSRFSHSIGTCHIAGKIFNKLIEKYPTKIKRNDLQLYRLAALLHDIGHYPFSHAMEQVVKDYYRMSDDKYVQSTFDKSIKEKLDDTRYFSHEDVGRTIIEKDVEISSVLRDSDFPPSEISSMILKERKKRFDKYRIIASDLDADRIDYLKRTSHHTSLPYGAIDENYLINQIKIDDTGRICINDKAIRAADHLLLSRYFAYFQVSFHRDVIAFEELMKQIIRKMLEDENDDFDCSLKWVEDAIENGDWYNFDDPEILTRIRKYSKSIDDEILKNKIEMLLRGKPPVLLAQREVVADRQDDNEKVHSRTIKKLLLTEIEKILDGSGIDKEAIFFWDYRMPLTKIGHYVRSSSSEKTATEIEETIHVLKNKCKTSKPIFDYDLSLLKTLSNKEISSLRLYYIPAGSDDSKDKKVINTIQENISENLPQMDLFDAG